MIIKHNYLFLNKSYYNFNKKLNVYDLKRRFKDKLNKNRKLLYLDF